MSFFNFFFFTILSLILFISCFSQQEITIEEFIQNDTVSVMIELEENEVTILEDKTNSRDIKTVRCHKLENELSLPIINLNSDEKLLISFDDLDADVKDYYFTIIHCNEDWSASDLMQSEYILSHHGSNACSNS